MNSVTASKERGPFSQKVAVSVVYVAAMFMSVMDGTIVNVALPTIGKDLAVSPTSVGTISIAYLVSLAVFIPASGWLGDRFGGKRVLIAATIIFTVASALCGIATNLDELLAFRVLQGTGGGMLAPVGLAMLYRVFPPEERVRASSILVVPTALAPAIGPVLGGLVVSDLSWRWVFYVNVPIGIVACIFGALYVKRTVDPEPGRFDVRGFLLAAAGLGLSMYGTSEGPTSGWGSVTVLTTIGAGVVFLAVLVVVALRTSQPILAFRLLTNRLFRSANIVLMTVSSALFGTLYVTSLYFQNGRGLSALQTGLSTLPSAVGILLGAIVASRFIYPVLGPRRTITIGLTTGAVSVTLLSLLGGQSSLWWARLLLFTTGLALAHATVPTQAAAFATISPAQTGSASTLFNTVRQISSALGVALLTTVIVLVGATHHVGGEVVANMTAYRVTFLVTAGLCLVGIPFALSIHDEDAASTMPKRHSDPATGPDERHRMNF